MGGVAGGHEVGDHLPLQVPEVSARCDLSDLPVEQCACRIHGPKELQKPTTIRTGQPFPAQFGGYCEAGSDRIHVGDLIVRVEVADGVFSETRYDHQECG